MGDYFTLTLQQNVFLFLYNVTSVVAVQRDYAILRYVTNRFITHRTDRQNRKSQRKYDTTERNIPRTDFTLRYAEAVADLGKGRGTRCLLSVQLWKVTRRERDPSSRTSYTRLRYHLRELETKT